MKTTFALAALATSAAAQYRGFNYGSTATDGSAETQDTFSSLFNNAKNLKTTEAFSSARLYTMIQAGTTNGVVQALPAAANTGTSLLLGMWASAGQDAFDNELAALRSAISAYPDLVNQIAGLSVGSEDLYRITPTGIANKAGVGAAPTVLTSYISQVRSALAGTSWSGVKVGHVDTWTAYVNGSNSAVIDACDFIGVDAYPYFETTLSNSIANGETLFDQAYDATVGVAGGKPVWITETGWPLSGPQSGDAIASVANAKTYWDAVACKYLGKTNVWWYTLFDGTSSPSFGLVGSTLSTTPEFSLSCPGGLSGASSSATSSATIASSATIIGTATSAVSVAAYSSATEEPASSAAPIYGSAAASAYGSVAPSSNAPAQPVPAVTPQIVSQITDGQVQAPTAAPGTVTAVASTTPTSSACPANLSGSYQFPHLIVPVDSSKPDEAEGTQYNGQVSSTVSTAFNFDIPESYEGQTCSLIFLFPEKADLETSDYSLSGSGGLDVKLLSSPATESTSFNTLPSIAKDVGGVSDLQSGNSYVITSGPCAAGEKISYEVSATGSLALNFFEDYNPSPLGLYIASC